MTFTPGLVSASQCWVWPFLRGHLKCALLRSRLLLSTVLHHILRVGFLADAGCNKRKVTKSQIAKEAGWRSDGRLLLKRSG